MDVRYFALAYGIVFLLVGIAGFVPPFVMPPEILPAAGEAAAADARLFGLFPVNALHNLVHIAFGLWGLIAWRGFGPARIYARSVAVIYAVFVVMGLIPVLNTVWGLVPLYGHNIWLHAVLAAVAAWFGWKPLRPVAHT
jgi:hypothetical protein